MSVTLGVDPGTAITAYAALDGTTLLRTGIIDLRGDDPWPVKRQAAELALRGVIADLRPDVVAIERTQCTRPKEGDSAGRVFSMAVLTQHTEELAAAFTGLAVAHGAQVVRVTPAAGLKALSLKRGATDRQVSEAFAVLFGQKLLVRDHHIARAAGVALRGAAQARIEKAGAA